MPAAPVAPPLQWRRRCGRPAPLSTPSSAEILQKSALQDGHVLVAPAGAANENSRTRVSLRIAPRTEKSVCTFNGRQNALVSGAFGQRIQGFIVGRRFVADAAAFHQVGVLGADAGIIEARGHGMGFPHLAIGVLQYQRVAALQNTGSAESQRGRIVPEPWAAP